MKTTRMQVFATVTAIAVVFVLSLSAQAQERVGNTLQRKMCRVSWRGRNRFGDGDENGRP